MPESTLPGSPVGRLCCEVSRSAGEQLAGTAPCHERLLLAEVPLPWAGKLLASATVPPALLEALREAAGAVRLQALVPDAEYSVPGYLRLLYFERAVGRGTPMGRTELLVPEARLGEATAALLVGRAKLLPEEWRQEGARRDLLLCAHGEHDVCCGRLGLPLYEACRYGDLPAGTRVWRTSHLGGHRFAPTLLELPSGRYWGRLDVELLKPLLRRGPLAELIACYRGWGALSSRPEQVAEAELFRRLGWPWAAAPRRCRAVAEGEAAWRIRFEAGEPVAASYEVIVELASPVVTLHSSGDSALVSEPQYQVASVEERS